jgi:hypothetical protein
MSLDLTPQVLSSLAGTNFLVFEFFSQKVIGIHKSGDAIDLGNVAPHSSRLLRIAPWDGKNPVLAGTDMHFSAGGVEIISWDTSGKGIRGKINTRWRYPVQVQVAFPAENELGYTQKSVSITSGQETFYLDIRE